MRVYIKSFKLLNFQSWDNNSPDIPIESDIVNIIEGANETGKSVLYKVLYNMCFPGYWSAEELIRRGFETACMFLSLSNGCIVAYELSRRNHAYYLQENGETFQWSDCDIPDRIVEMLGLILDRESQVILNVIDKDVPLPFIKSTPKFNASLIRAVVEPVKITDFFSRLTDHLKEVDNAKSIFKSKTEAASEAAAVLEYQNVETLYYQKAQTDRILYVTESVVAFAKQLEEYAVTIRNKPVEVTEPIVASSLLKVYDELCECSQAVSSLQDALIREPTVIVSPENVEIDLSVLDDIQAASAAITELQRVSRNAPEEVVLPNVDVYLAVWDVLDILKTVLEQFAYSAEKVHKHKMIMETLNSEIQKIKSEVGVCPTCGRLL